MLPAEVQIRDTLRFLTETLGERRRVLEVGCGDGALARRLAGAGFEVTALDRALPDAEATPGVGFVVGDFFDFEAPPFDAVVFTASLHHLSPLADAVARARRMTVAGGLIVADDFDVEAPDRATARWFYDALERLAGIGLCPPERVGPAVDDPLERWRAHHDHDLHTGAALRSALAVHGPATATRGPYLYRYLGGQLPATDGGGRIAADLLEAERAAIRDAAIVAVGLRIVVTAS